MSMHSYANTIGNTVIAVETPYWKRIIHRGRHRRGRHTAVALLGLTVWSAALYTLATSNDKA